MDLNINNPLGKLVLGDNFSSNRVLFYRKSYRDQGKLFSKMVLVTFFVTTQHTLN